jgi:TM2 domain-containing membrane protein YozV
MGFDDISPKSRLVALLLCFFLGPLGVHRFYVGKVGTGVVMILTIGGLGIWALIDFIMIAVGSFRDKEGRRVFRWTEPGSM